MIRPIGAMAVACVFAPGCGARISLGTVDALDAASEPLSTAADAAIVEAALEAGDDAQVAGNAITGTANGTPFTSVSSAWWIQLPDPRVDGGPVASTVVYLFSKPVPCSALSVAKWDESGEPGDTQDLEIEAAWAGAAAPGSPPPVEYPVVAQSSSTPLPGEAAATYHRAPGQPPGAGVEVIASGGSVVVMTLAPGDHVAGTFAVTFPGGDLTGDFDAAYCPNGREP